MLHAAPVHSPVPSLIPASFAASPCLSFFLSPPLLPCRPQGASKLLALGAQYPRIVRVRAEWVTPDAKSKARAGGWALKTKRERILM